MAEILLEYMIASVSVKMVLNLVFLGFFFRRINKLDKMASLGFAVFPKAMYIKIALILCVMLLESIEITLANVDATYWMYPYKNYAFADITVILNAFLQIYIIRRENKKGAVKAVSLGLFWSFSLILAVVEAAYILTVSPNIGITLAFALTLIEAILLGVFIFSESSTIPREALSFLDTKESVLPLIYTREERQRKAKLYIQFNKEFQVTQKNNSYICSFKIAVYVGQQTHVITKKQDDFSELSRQMVQLFPESEEVLLKENLGSQPSMMKLGEEKQKIYQNYLITITKTDRYYSPVLIDFLEIKPCLRKLFVSQPRFLRKDTVSDEEEGSAPKHPFFHVEIRNHKFYVSNPEILEVIVNRKIDQIVAFHAKLIAEKRLTMELLSEDISPQEIVHFLGRVANSKGLWRSFAQWMNLGRQLQDKIYRLFDPWTIGFKNISMEIIGYEVAFDKEGAIHTLYLLSIQRRNAEDKASKILKKRYNDFAKLDKHVRKFASHSHFIMPSLPPKFSPFGSKTSPKSRQIYFDLYIKELLKIEQINHCIKFLEFIEGENMELEQLFEAEQTIESSVISAPSSPMPDDL